MNYWNSKSILKIDNISQKELQSNLLNYLTPEKSCLDHTKFENDFYIDYVSDKNIKSVCDFLHNNYIFSFSEIFLKWYILNYSTPIDFNIILYNKKTNNIVGIIIATLRTISLYNEIYNCPIINLLCVDKNYRNNYICAYLIDIISKNIKNKNILIAIFTKQKELKNSQPFDVKKIFIKILNIKSFLNNQMIILSPTLFRRRIIKEYSLKIYKKDFLIYNNETSYIDEIILYNKVQKHSKNKNLCYHYNNIEDFRYWNKSKDNIIYSFYDNTNFIVILKMNYKNITKGVVIYNILDKNSDIFLKKIFYYLYTISFDFIEIQENEYLDIYNKLDIKEDNKLYYYIYNYNFKFKIDNNLNLF